MEAILVAVDTKNLALYGGGIAQWFAPLLAAWIEDRSDIQFHLLGPDFRKDFLPNSGNWEHMSVLWPEWLPRPLRHPFYDNIQFPRAVARLKPDLVMSPYHDVRMPKGVPSVIGVHDLCYDELSSVYPQHIRGYYLGMLQYNIRRASQVITVSQTTRYKLTNRCGVPLERISVVYNAANAHFDNEADKASITEFRRRFAINKRFLFYPGGSEFRKNIRGLVQAFAVLLKSEPELTLLVTGNENPRWKAALENVPLMTRDRIQFTSQLSDRDLRLAYASADAVVYPSFCEGFGRVCLEAMEAGAPLACSDLPIMHEVAGDYACYFDPYDCDSIVGAIGEVMSLERRSVVRDPRFQLTAVKNSFLVAMDAVTHEISKGKQPHAAEAF